MTVQIDVKPETAIKFQIAAAALNLSIQEYLDRVAALLASGHNGNLDQPKDTPPFELGKDFIGQIDTSLPNSSAKPHQTAFGELLLEKYKKQGLDLP